jgi:hypothetical protein
MGETPWHLAGDHRPIQHIMKTIVTQYSFIESFRACGRENQFSYPAMCALFAHLERWEEDTDTELELDPVALCCDWQEFDSPLEGAKAFGFQVGLDDSEETPIEWLTNRTDVVQFWENGVLVRVF